MMRVLLVRPTYDMRSIAPNFPIGLACLASILRKEGHDPTLLDLPLEPRAYEELERVLRSSFFELVGISSMTIQYPGANV